MIGGVTSKGRRREPLQIVPFNEKSLLKNILIVGVESQTIHSFKAMSNFETAFQDDGAVTKNQRAL
jgi:hypothetical protein